jgi:hypothetical protein
VAIAAGGLSHRVQVDIQCPEWRSRSAVAKPSYHQPADLLAGQPELGSGGGDRRQYLGGDPLQHGDPVRRVTGHPGLSLRGGVARRCQCVAAIPLCESAIAQAGYHRRANARLDLHDQGVRRDHGDDPGRSRRRDGLPPVQTTLFDWFSWRGTSWFCSA